jgi:branched-chain amino acid transport system substrate-binding protein
MKKSMALAAVFLVIAIAIPGCWNKQTTTSNTVKIGVVVPLTGNAGVLGDYTLKGLQLAVDDQNSKGGLLGKKIELDVQDSKADPKEGVAVVKNMLAANLKPFLVYSIMSGVTMAIKPETEKNNILLMSAVGTDKFLENSRYTIRNYVSATTIGQNLAPYVKDTMQAKTLLVFYSNNEYGQSVKDAVKKFGEQGGLSVTTEPYEETSQDYKSLIAAKVNKGIECIYVAGVGKGLGTMIKQIRESGYTGKLVGDQLITFPDVINVAGDALKGMPYLDFAFDVSSNDAATKSFVDSFKGKFHTDPQNFSVITYDGAKLLFSAIESNQTIDAAKLVEALNGTKSYAGVFGPVSVTDRNVNFTFNFKQWH